jgi:hypothetical protein
MIGKCTKRKSGTRLIIIRRSLNRLNKDLPGKSLCHFGLDPESSIYMDSCLRRNDTA